MKETLQRILGGLMTISVKGNDVITLSDCMQTLDMIIQNAHFEDNKPEEAPIAIEPEVIENND